MTNDPSASPKNPTNGAGAGRRKASPAATPATNKPGPGPASAAPVTPATAVEPGRAANAPTHPAADPTAATAAPDLQATVGQLADQALAEGKKVADRLHLGQLTGQFPQAVRDLGARIAGGIRGLSTTQ